MDNVYGVADLTVAVTHPKGELEWLDHHVP